MESVQVVGLPRNDQMVPLAVHAALHSRSGVSRPEGGVQNPGEAFSLPEAILEKLIDGMRWLDS